MFVDFTDLTLDSGVVLARTASLGATVVEATGAVATKATGDTPRFSYFLSGATYLPGLLVEEARTNLARSSADWSAAPWTTAAAGSVTITRSPNFGVAPDGTFSTTRVKTTGDAGITQVIAGLTAGATYTMSFWVRRVGSVNQTFRYNTSVGFSANVTATATLTRVSHTVTVAGTSAFFGITRDTTNTPYDLEVWGFQIEAAATATSYIPTTSTVQTRAAETAYMRVDESGANVPYPGFQQGQGAVAVEFMLPAVNGAWSSHLFTYSDGSNSNSIAGYVSTAGTVVIEVISGGVMQATLNLGAYTPGAIARVAASWAANRFAASFNGGAVQTAASGSVPVVTRLDLMNRPDGTRAGNGHIRWIIASETALADADVPSFAPTFVGIGAQPHAPTGQTVIVIEATVVAVGANDNAPVGEAVAVVEATNIAFNPPSAAPVGQPVAIVEASVIAVGAGGGTPHGRSIRLLYTPVTLIPAATPAARRGVAAQASRRGAA